MRRIRIRIAGIAALLFAAIGAATPASAARIDPEAALEKSGAAIGRITSDHRLVRSDATSFKLSELRGRPLVISLVYTSCSTVCPVGTETLKRSVGQARSVLGGTSFQVLTLGFDARNDTPRRLEAFAADHDIDNDPLWRLATASPAVLKQLLEEVGFSYAGAAGGFDHVAQTTILDAEGRVYRQIYGDEFPPQVLIEPLKQLVYGLSVASFTPAAIADRVRFLCTVYDPKLGRYRISYTIFLEMGIGVLSLALMGWMIRRMWRGSKRVA